MFLVYGLGESFILPITNFTAEWRNLILYYMCIPYLLLNFTSFYILETPM